MAGTRAAAGARATVRRLGRGGVRLPDRLARLIRFAMSTAPRWLGVRILGQVMRGMTGIPKPVAAG